MGSCRCGTEVRNASQRLGCIECGSTCCPSCGIQLESAIYCETCAGSLLETATVRSGSPFDLQ